MFRETLLLLLFTFAFSTPFTVQENVRMERVGGPWVSKDGQFAVFSARTWHPETNNAEIQLWRTTLNGKPDNEILLTNCAEERCVCSDVAFSPKDPLIFAYIRDGQLWVMNILTKNTRRVSDFPVSISNLRWDSDYLAFTAEVYPKKSMEETAKIDKLKAAQKFKGMTFDRLMIRHWDEFFEGKYNHVFIAQLTPDWTLVKMTDIMLDIEGDCPSRPDGGAEEFSVSPSGEYVAYNLKPIDGEAWHTKTNIFLYHIGSRALTCITAKNSGRDMAPAWSPDSTKIAYVSTEVDGNESDRNKIRLYDLVTKETRVLTEQFDRSVDGGLQFRADSSAIVFHAEDQARTKIFNLDMATLQVTPLTNEGTVSSFVLVPAQNLVVFALSRYTHPTDIFALNEKDKTILRYTNRNKDRLAAVTLSTPDELHFVGANNDQIQAWFFKPADYVEGRQYPLVVYIHGGPENPWKDAWSYRWNPQTIAAQGFAVFAPNFHGTSSFGQEFTRSILLRWGTWPFEDIMKGIDYVTSTKSWVIPDRISAMGASYGGFMINWLNGHTNRFKSLICHDGIFDTRAFYYNTEELWFPEAEFGGPVHVNSTYYEMYNPSLFVQNWKTPMLIVHGGRDYRIPDTHGIGAFTALQRRGIPSKLLHFPDENHFVTKPYNSIQWHNEVIAWLRQWT